MDGPSGEEHPGPRSEPIEPDPPATAPPPPLPASPAGAGLFVRVDAPDTGPQPLAEVPPPEEAASAEVPPLPTARELISVGLDLALRTSASIRTASMAIGFQLLAAAGPLVLLVIVIAAKAPTSLDGLFAGTPPAPGSRDEALIGSFGAALTIAALALAALTAESRIVAAALLGGAAARRPISPHEALRRSRQVFWRVLGATLVVQIPLVFVSIAIVDVAGIFVGGSPEAVQLLGVAVTTLLMVPFAYILTGIVLGGAPPGEAIRRSVELARVRWRLALVAAIADALTQTLLQFGLLAGLGVVGTVASALGLGVDSGPIGTFLTVVLALLGTAAVGSLIFTVAAIAAAPQVVAFVGLTRYTAAIDGARDGPGARRVRWVSIPMAVGIVLALLASLAGVSTAMRPG